MPRTWNEIVRIFRALWGINDTISRRVLQTILIFPLLLFVFAPWTNFGFMACLAMIPLISLAIIAYQQPTIVELIALLPDVLPATQGMGRTIVTMIMRIAGFEAVLALLLGVMPNGGFTTTAGIIAASSALFFLAWGEGPGVAMSRSFLVLLLAGLVIVNCLGGTDKAKAKFNKMTAEHGPTEGSRGPKQRPARYVVETFTLQPGEDSGWKKKPAGAKYFWVETSDPNPYESLLLYDVRDLDGKTLSEPIPVHINRTPIPEEEVDAKRFINHHRDPETITLMAQL